jgi:hypothetical protein
MMDTPRSRSSRDGSAWALLDDALNAGPDPLAFRAACAALLRFSPGELGAAMLHARAALERWEDADRTAPWTWACALAVGVSEPGVALARALRLTPDHLGCRSVSLATLPDTALRDLRALHADGFTDDDSPSALEVLTSSPERYASLRRVSQRWGDADAPVSLARCRWFQEATDCDLQHARELFGDDSAAAAPLIRRLSVETSDIAETLRSLEQHAMPALHALELRGPNFPVIPGDEPSLGSSSLLSRVDELSLVEPPTLAVRAIFRSGLLRLRGLSLCGHGETAYGGLEPGDVRLGEADLHLMASSGALATLERLRIDSEVAGDAIVDLVACTEPGLLRELSLEGVMLSDAGARRLAMLPHIKHLESLALRDNGIGPDGFAVVAAALSGGKLRRLQIGARGNTPYYWRTTPRADGDDFARALVRAELPALTELAFTRLALSVRGARSLAEAAWGRELTGLDLSHDAPGPDGLRSLVGGELVRNLRTLKLDECGVDDAAAMTLAGARFERLRDLSLGYGDIGPRGAEQLASAECLATLYRLSLHDNVVGNRGFQALARSPHLKRLVELDIEQDCWNARCQTFGVEAARALVESETFANLDAIYGGIVDEYHGARYAHPFDTRGMALLAGTVQLRAPAVQGLLAVDVGDDEAPFACVDDDDPAMLDPDPAMWRQDFRRRERSSDR